MLRETLERGLQSEQSKVYPYVEKELQKAIGEIHIVAKENKVRSPMYQALLDAGIGDDIYGGYDSGTYQPVFSIIAKNAKFICVNNVM